MDEPAELIDSDTQGQSLHHQQTSADDATSQPFVGRWNRLISQTNWEKGQIIFHWREAMQGSGAAASLYSDDAWSRIVGGVTPQHVGRLRRVYERFASSHEEYHGLCWSHFFAAVEWDDAEMWLEGAVQNQWSVANMRQTRGETLGDVANTTEGFEEPVTMDSDEDFQPLISVRGEDDDAKVYAERSEAEASSSDPDATDEESSAEPWETLDTGTETSDPVRPFAGLPELPDDLAEAFEACKLAILAHKANQWREVAHDDVLVSLDALKALVVLQS